MFGWATKSKPREETGGGDDVNEVDTAIIESRADNAAPIPQYSTKGKYGLKTCHDSSDAVADIVFVHGLTGNRESTWTDKASGVFWPATLLKIDVPRTRIMTFGYDADVAHFWAMAAQNRIGNHALNLANALTQMRERTDTEERPIIFVTHSLGGLVFEDTLLCSKNSAETHIQGLLERTVGVCFLGTPHCGSQLANWESIFGSLVNVVKTTNSSLLGVLKPGSEVLARIQQDFHTMLRARRDQGKEQLKITCFYEELPVRGVGEIVPKHSAILPAYNSIGIHANHMDMTKYASAKDAGYLAVSTEIMRWVRVLIKAASAQPSWPTPSVASQSQSSFNRYREEQRSPPQRQQRGYFGDQAGPSSPDGFGQPSPEYFILNEEQPGSGDRRAHPGLPLSPSQEYYPRQSFSHGQVPYQRAPSPYRQQGVPNFDDYGAAEDAFYDLSERAQTTSPGPNTYIQTTYSGGKNVHGNVINAQGNVTF